MTCDALLTRSKFETRSVIFPQLSERFQFSLKRHTIPRRQARSSVFIVPACLSDPPAYRRRAGMPAIKTCVKNWFGKEILMAPKHYHISCISNYHAMHGLSKMRFNFFIVIVFTVSFLDLGFLIISNNLVTRKWKITTLVRIPEAFFRSVCKFHELFFKSFLWENRWMKLNTLWHCGRHCLS